MKISDARFAVRYTKVIQIAVQIYANAQHAKVRNDKKANARDPILDLLCKIKNKDISNQMRSKAI